MKSGLFTLSVHVGGEKKRREKKGRKGGVRGRVGEEDRAGGEGEFEDSCADNQTLLTFV